MTKIAVLDDYQGVALEMADWSVLGTNVEISVLREHLAEDDSLVDALLPHDIVVAMRERTPFPQRLFARLPNLRLLVTTGMRNRSIDLLAAREHGVLVCGTDGMYAPTVELTWALILSLLRNIPVEDGNVRAGRWQTTLGTIARGKTLGVLGLGNIGSQVAAIGSAFGMRVIAWSQNLTSARAADAGATLVERDELFRQSDLVTIHLILGDRTRGLVGARELALMRPTAYLVNTSRGPIVDEGPLASALANGTIAGAALDVYGTEPLPPDEPIRQLPRSVMTPHIGYVTRDEYQLFYRQIVEDIAAFQSGQPIRELSG